MRRILFALTLALPAVAFAQGAPTTPAPEAAPTGPTEPVEVKHDQGTVRTVDAQSGKLIADMPDGPVTYDISQAQLLDLSGKPAGVASTGLHAGDKVRITYRVDDSCEHKPACKGAIASEVRLVK